MADGCHASAQLARAAGMKRWQRPRCAGAKMDSGFDRSTGLLNANSWFYRKPLELFLQADA